MELPSDDSLRWLVSEYAAIRAAYGEGIGDPVLVQPTPEDFPDDFELSVEGVSRFLARMLDYAPVKRGIEVRLRVMEGDEAGGGSCGTGGCGTGACGTGKGAKKDRGLTDRVIDAGDGYIVELPATAARHPLRLAATLARSVGSIVLFEAGEEPEDEELGPASEFMAAACGFGVLLLAGSHIFGKSCGGVNVDTATHLGLEELSVMVALFARVHGVKPGSAREHLAPTQRDAFAEALAWVDSNPELVSDLTRRPEVLEDGVFTVQPVKGLFGRWFGGNKKDDEPEVAPVSAKPRPARSAEDQKRLDEARALVDAALSGAER